MTTLALLLSAVAALAGGLLMLIVLLQEPRNSALGGTLGGRVGDVIAPSAAPVDRLVGGLAAVWVGACLLLALGLG